MKKLNNQGFGAIEAILIIVVLAILGFVGYRAYQVYTGNKSADSMLSQKQGDLKTFESKITNVSFRYPSDWEQTKVANGRNELTEFTGTDGLKLEWAASLGVGGACGEIKSKKDKIYIHDAEKVSNDLYIVSAGTESEVFDVGLMNNNYYDENNELKIIPDLFDKNGNIIKGYIDICEHFFGFRSSESIRNGENTFLGTSSSMQRTGFYEKGYFEDNDNKRVELKSLSDSQLELLKSILRSVKIGN